MAASTIISNGISTQATDQDWATRTISHNSTTNVTPTESYYDSFNPGTPFDITMDCLLAYALALSAYLVLVLSYHEWFLHKAGTSNRRAGARVGKIRIAPWLRILCILSAIFCLLRCINDIIYYKASAMSDIPCTVVKNMGVSWLVGVDTTVYLFLWLRQKVLYQKRSMRKLSNPILSFISWFSLLLIIAIFVVMNVLLIWRKYRYVPVKAKCSKERNPIVAVIPKLFTTSSTLLHILLVGLCVYPLIRHTISQRQRGTPKGNQGACRMLKKEQSATSNGQKSLMPVVIRYVAISIVCVATDGLAIAIAEYGVTADEHTKLRHFLYDINIIINVFAIVVSFKNWKIMLFPCSRWKRSDEDSSEPRRESLFTTTSMNPDAIHRVET